MLQTSLYVLMVWSMIWEDYCTNNGQNRYLIKFCSNITQASTMERAFPQEIKLQMQLPDIELKTE